MISIHFEFESIDDTACRTFCAAGKIFFNSLAGELIDGNEYGEENIEYVSRSTHVHPLNNRIFVSFCSEKRKYASPTPTSSEIGRRLEKLRSMQGNLWDDDDDERDLQPCVQPKTTTVTATTNNKTYIVLSDSDDEKAASRRRDKATKPRKKVARDAHEHESSERQTGTASLRCATCLICSLLTTLTPYNCCSKHLAILLNSKSPQSTATASHPWPPQQVMIVPMTDELLQRYLDPQQIHSLKTQRSTSPVKRKGTKRNTSVSFKIAEFIRIVDRSLLVSTGW